MFHIQSVNFAKTETVVLSKRLSLTIQVTLGNQSTRKEPALFGRVNLEAL